MILDVTDGCDERDSGSVNPEIWWENIVRIGFRITHPFADYQEGLLIDHQQFFNRGPRIYKYTADHDPKWRIPGT